MTAKINNGIKLHFFVITFLSAFGLTTAAKDTKTYIRPNILRIADKLQKDNQVHFGYPVGFGGKPETKNKFYKLYKKLGAKATNEELVELTKSKIEIIVVYAFDILQSRNYDGIKNIFLDHVNDTTWFWTAGGCTGFITRINWFMLRRLKPAGDDTIKNYLTKHEFDLYCSRFKNEDRLFSCD